MKSDKFYKNLNSTKKIIKAFKYADYIFILHELIEYVMQKKKILPIYPFTAPSLML